MAGNCVWSNSSGSLLSAGGPQAEVSFESSAVKTHRYYEEIGLVQVLFGVVAVPIRGALGLHRLRFLRRASGLGFSVNDYRMLFSLYQDTDRAPADVKEIAETHLSEIDRKLAELQTLRAALTTLVDACHGDDLPDGPIRDDLAGRRLMDGCARQRTTKPATPGITRMSCCSQSPNLGQQRLPGLATKATCRRTTAR